MKIYLDTGNIDEIKKAASFGVLDGVTTNPSLIAKQGGDFKKIIKSIVSILKKESVFDFTVSAEVISLDWKSMVKEGVELSKIDKHVLVKIPLIEEGIRAVSVLSKKDIKCNVTLCFSANQALLAAKAGAWCVSPFVGRVDDEGYDGIVLVEDIKKIYSNYGFKTKILAASVRSTRDVLDCAKAGVDIVTVPKPIYDKLIYNPLTTIGLDKFNEDWNKYIKEVK